MAKAKGSRAAISADKPKAEARSGPLPDLTDTKPNTKPKPKAKANAKAKVKAK